MAVISLRPLLAALGSGRVLLGLPQRNPSAAPCLRERKLEPGDDPLQYAWVAELAAKFDACWNRRDSDGLSGLFFEEGTLKFSLGRALRGRDEIRRRYDLMFLLLPRAIEHKTHVLLVRFLRPDAAVCKAVGDICAPSWRGGAVRLLDRIDATVIVTREEGEWKIVALRLCSYRE